MISKGRLVEIKNSIGTVEVGSYECGQLRTIEQLIEECGDDWMPIADAPKDRRIILWYPKPKNKSVGMWDKEVGDWWIDNYGYCALHQPTLWQDLPADPK